MRITHRPRAQVTAGNADRLCGLMKPGDLVLKWCADDPVSKTIWRFQKSAGIPDEGCKITHVSMFTGGNTVFHATFDAFDAELSTCRSQNFVDYYAGHEVSLVTPSPSSSLADEDRIELLRRTEGLEGTPYASRALPLLLAQNTIVEALLHSVRVDTEAKLRDHLGRGEVCSTLIANLYLRTFGPDSPAYSRADPPRTRFITPGYFFQLPTLSDVAARLA